MNRKELAAAIAAENELTQAAAERVLKTIVETVITTVKKGGEVAIVGFGTFKSVKRAARKGVNPSTGAALKIPASKSPKFVAGAPFKAEVSGKKPAAKAK